MVAVSAGNIAKRDPTHVLTAKSAVAFMEHPLFLFQFIVLVPTVLHLAAIGACLWIFFRRPSPKNIAWPIIMVPCLLWALLAYAVMFGFAGTYSGLPGWVDVMLVRPLLYLPLPVPVESLPILVLLAAAVLLPLQWWASGGARKRLVKIDDPTSLNQSDAPVPASPLPNQSTADVAPILEYGLPGNPLRPGESGARLRFALRAGIIASVFCVMSMTVVYWGPDGGMHGFGAYVDALQVLFGLICVLAAIAGLTLALTTLKSAEDDRKQMGIALMLNIAAAASVILGLSWSIALLMILWLCRRGRAELERSSVILNLLTLAFGVYYLLLPVIQQMFVFGSPSGTNGFRVLHSDAQLRLHAAVVMAAGSMPLADLAYRKWLKQPETKPAAASTDIIIHVTLGALAIAALLIYLASPVTIGD